MTFTSRRTAIAAALTTALAGTTISPYRPSPLRTGSGWLDLKQVDTEDSTLGDLRASYEVVIAIGTDPQQSEQRLDELSAPLIEACADIGRGVTVRPFIYNIDSTDFYCAVATLITEVGTI